MAKGARRPTSKFCGALELFSQDDIIFYRKEEKEIFTLSDAVVIEAFDRTRNSIAKFKAALVLCELLDKIMPSDEADVRIYNHSVSFLHDLNTAEETEAKTRLLIFILKILPFAGVKPSLDACVRCRREPAPTSGKYHFSLSAGGLVCDKDYDDTTISLNLTTVEMMRNLYAQQLMTINAKVVSDLKILLPQYLYYHLNGLILNSLKYI